MNQTIKQELQKGGLVTGKDWDEMLRFILMRIWAHPAASTKHSPFKLMTGREMPHLENLLSIIPEDVVV